jgi:hypothetical protein
MRLQIIVLSALALVLLAGLIDSAEAGAARRWCAPHCRRVERERRRTEREERREEDREQRAQEREEELLEEEGLLEEPFEEEPIVVGLDTGGWSGQLIGELLAGGIGEFRVQQSAAASVAGQAPGHIASITFGEEGTISQINPTAYAQEVLSVATQTHPLSVEVLNEPGGRWFWKDAETQASYTAYAKLTKAVHEALQTLPASSRPAEICNWESGNGGPEFGRAVKAAGGMAYCDGVTVHPYGGNSGQDGGALGNRSQVAQAHAESGLPVYVTEVGWPTAVGQPATGDSQQWSEAQQSENMSNFAAWARSTGYVKMVIFFNAVDYGSNNWYGIETGSRKHKQSFATLAALSA